MKTISFILFALLTVTGYSQNAKVHTIQWNVVEVTTSSGEVMDVLGDKLKVYPSDRIEWTDADNNVKFNFGIASTIGDWANVSEGGLIHYNFEMDGQSGEVIIQRSGGIIRAEIQLYKIGTESFVYTLVIRDYSVL